MKKLFYPLFALATMAMTNTSCSDEIENGATTNSNEAVVSFNVQLENEVGSRAVDGTKAGDGTKAKELHYAVYKADKTGATIGDELELLRGITAVQADLTANVKFTLVKGQTYNFLFWAQTPEKTYYTVNYEKGEIKVNYDETVDDAVTTETFEVKIAANDEERDAFYKVYTGLKIDGPIEETITLKRPFAQINVGTMIGSLKNSVTAEVSINNSQFVVSNAANLLNAYNGSVSVVKTNADGSYAQVADVDGKKVNLEVTYEKAGIIEKMETDEDGNYVCDENGDLLNVDGVNYEYLALNYILVNDQNVNEGQTIPDGTKKANIDGTFSIYSEEEEGDEPINTFTIPNIPVQRNWRTNIIGDIMNETVSFNIVIDPNFDNDHNYYTEKEMHYAAANGGEVTLKAGETYELKKTVRVAEGMTMILNLNGATITNTTDFDASSTDVFFVEEGGTLIINGEGNVTAVSGIDGYPVHAQGKVIINGGTYTTGVDANGDTNACIYAKFNGEVYINGGEFHSAAGALMINKHDGSRETSVIEIKGGTFHGFNPANNASEGAGTNFVAYGYDAVETEAASNVWTVVPDALEQATINGGTITLTEALATNEPMTVAKGKTLTLVLDGNKLSYDGDDILFRVNGTLVIDGSKDNSAITTTGGYVASVNAGGKVAVKGGTYTVDGPTCFQSNGGQLNIEGGVFEAKSDTYGTTFTLNHIDGQKENGLINVTGGTFVGYNPAVSYSENPAMCFVAEGYVCMQNAEGNWVVSKADKAVATMAELKAAAQAGGTIVLGKSITLTEVIVPAQDLVINLNGHTIDSSIASIYDETNQQQSALISVPAGVTVTIMGEGTVDCTATDDYAVEVRGGTLNVLGGTFMGQTTAAYAREGVINIMGGVFSDLGSYNGQYLLNCYDTNYKADPKTANIIVTGGTFMSGFNPAENVAEGAGTNFVADGYKSVKKEGYYVVRPE